MKITEIIPLIYWYRTRIGKPINIVSYFLINFIPFFIFFVYYGYFTWRTVFVFLGIWVAYLSIYELGYFINDFFSLLREHRKGINLNKKQKTKPHALYIFLYFIVRIIFSCLLLIFLKNYMFDKSFIYVMYIVIFIMLSFLLHNLLIYPYRVFTFFCLYFGKYFLIFAFLYGKVNIWVLIIFAFIPALTHTFAYSCSKKILLSNLSVNFSTLSFLLKLTSIGYFLVFILIRDTEFHVFFNLFAILFVIDLLIFIYNFLNGFFKLLKCNNKEIYHIHTTYSKDSKINISEIGSVFVPTNIKKIYITDHSECFSIEKYNMLLRELQIYNQNNNYNFFLVPGLEYEISGQHFLVLDLKEYISDCYDLSCIKRFKSCGAIVIWAHPHFALRKLFSIKYLLFLIKIMSVVDGFEFLNLKTVRNFMYYTWRHVLLSFIGIYLFGRKILIIGCDAHELKDIKIIC